MGLERNYSISGKYSNEWLAGYSQADLIEVERI